MEKNMKIEPMYYTPKTVIDLLLANKQKADYEFVISNPPFSEKTKHKEGVIGCLKNSGNTTHGK
jgi:16S rRNA G1207 methylase RsmC